MTLAFFCVYLLCAKLCSDNLSYLILRTTQWGRCHSLHFTDEEVKAQRAQTTASIWCIQWGDTFTHSLSHLLTDFLSISIYASVYPFIWIDNIFSWLKTQEVQNGTRGKICITSVPHLSPPLSSSYLQRQAIFWTSWVSFPWYVMHTHKRMHIRPLLFLHGRQHTMHTVLPLWVFPSIFWSFIILFYTGPILLHPAYSHWEANQVWISKSLSLNFHVNI